jgi:Rieske Fe-S protein
LVIATGAGLAAVAGCSYSSKNSMTRTATGTAGIAIATTTEFPTAGASPGSSLTRLDQVPVGGSASAKLNGSPVLVSQPTAGHVKAFLAICTHQGCTVAPAGPELHCPCHGSVYDAFTGAVKKGPAQRPLREIPAVIIGDDIQLG